MYYSYNIYTLNWNFRWEKYTFGIVYLYPVHLHHLQHFVFVAIFLVLYCHAVDWIVNCSAAYAECPLRLELTPESMDKIFDNKFDKYAINFSVFKKKKKTTTVYV